MREQRPVYSIPEPCIVRLQIFLVHIIAQVLEPVNEHLEQLPGPHELAIDQQEGVCAGNLVYRRQDRVRVTARDAELQCSQLM